MAKRKITMATITEDYVSFKIAKMLKEKGFDGILSFIYVDTEKSDKNVHLTDTLCNYNDGHIKDIISAPTLQMAMKWLREVHNISIEPLVDFGSGNGYWWTADVGYIKKDGLIDELCGYNSYEEAVEAAIKYCLENLI